VSYNLYLVRHAIAEEHAPTGRDADRRLTHEGATKMQRAALGLKRLGVAPDAVWSSPLRRAQQTAELLCSELAPGLAVTSYAPLAPGHGSTVVLAGLRPGRDVHSLVLVGHEPDLCDLALHLIAGAPMRGSIEFRKGSVAAFELAELPPKSPAQLLWLLTPKQQRIIGEQR
jgi:phosphohistidine phosphatase